MPELFPMIPAPAKTYWMLGVIMAILVIVLGTLAYTAYWSRNVQFEVRSTGLKILGDFYGREIPAAALVASGIRRLDFNTEPDYRPKWRTLGTGLPGYAAGWFRLRNGDKALVYLTTRKDVVLIPTTLGYVVLLSVTDPDSFIERLTGIATS